MHQLQGVRAAAGAERHLQGVEHERAAHVGGELPADDLAVEHVEDECEIGDALPASEVYVRSATHS